MQCGFVASVALVAQNVRCPFDDRCLCFQLFRHWSRGAEVLKDSRSNFHSRGWQTLHFHRCSKCSNVRSLLPLCASNIFKLRFRNSWRKLQGCPSCYSEGFSCFHSIQKDRRLNRKFQCHKRVGPRFQPVHSAGISWAQLRHSHLFQVSSASQS